MSQLSTLIWLKWRLLRNSLRSSTAMVNKLATVLGMLAALAVSLVVALSLGIMAYFLAKPGVMGEFMRRSARGEVQVGASTEFIFFSIFAFMYLTWATIPLSIGGSKQFDAGKLLMYPISLRKLFAVDFRYDANHRIVIPELIGHESPPQRSGEAPRVASLNNRCKLACFPQSY